MENLILETISRDKKNKKILKLRFTKRKSCLTNQINSYYQITNLVDEGRAEGGFIGMYTQREFVEKMESYSSVASNARAVGINWNTIGFL